MEQNYMEILLEEMRGKFDLVLEGFASLDAKIDEFRRESNEKHEHTALMFQAVKDRLDTMDLKVDAVAADLSAHRADTESHPRYLVRE